MKEVKKGICLWVYSECPTDAPPEFTDLEYL